MQNNFLTDKHNMNRLKILSTALLFSLLPLNLFAQSIPHGYKDVTLGMSLQETKNALLKDSDFGYHGDRDVSLIPNTQQTLIETDSEYGLGSNFLQHCYFQFAEDKLYIITININPDRMDYYSIFTTLCEKYGQPDALNPQMATWQNDDVTMTLEKPLTLKYVDNNIFNSVKTSSNVPLSGTEMTREQFLDEL